MLVALVAKPGPGRGFETRMTTPLSFKLLPRSSACKESTMGDLGSMSGPGRYPEEGNGYPPSVLTWRTYGL